MQKNAPKRDVPGKEGIALIVVLGMLSLIIILGFGFAVSMRTERLAANSATEAVKNRQLLQVALARAVEDIGQDMVSANVVYPDDIYLSGDFSENGQLIETVTNLFSGEATNFVPRHLHAAADGLAANWIKIEDPHSTNILGRYAFMALDSSGFLDINTIHNTNMIRARGTNTGEIQIGQLPEISNLAGFLNNRATNWVRFESLPDIAATARRLGTLNQYPSNVFHYSHFPPDLFVDMVPNDPRERLYIGGNSTSYENDTDFITNFIARMQNVGFTADEAGLIFTNFIDYIDTDTIPRSLEIPSTEPVPMINEIVFKGEFSAAANPGGGVDFTLQIRAEVELWFPYARRPAQIFRLAPVMASFPVPSAAVGSPFEALYQGLDPTQGGSVTPTNIQPQTISVENTGYYIITNSYNPRTVNVTNLPVLPGLPVAVDFGGVALLDGSGNTNDYVGAVLPGQFLMPPFLNNQTFDQGPSFGLAARDPRLNHLSGAPNWQTYTGPQTSLGQMNQNAASFTGGDPPFDGPSSGMSGPLSTNTVLMFARQGPMERTAELGFIPTGQPWKTIKLYGDNMHRVLDEFTTVLNPSPEKGKVNINTPLLNVMAAPFRGAAIESHPPGPLPANGVTGTVTIANAQNIASELIASNSITLFTNLSQMGMISDSAYKQAVQSASSLILDAHIESIIANTADLFSFRQNIFTLILAAQTTRTDPAGDETVVGEQRAVAVVWRDPFPNSSGRHATFTKFYKILAD